MDPICKFWRNLARTKLFCGSFLVSLLIVILQLLNLDMALSQQVPTRIDRLQITRGSITPPSLTEAARLQENLIRSTGPSGRIDVRQFSRTDPSAVRIQGPIPLSNLGAPPQTNAPSQLRGIVGPIPLSNLGASTQTPTPGRLEPIQPRTIPLSDFQPETGAGTKAKKKKRQALEPIKRGPIPSQNLR